MLEALGIAPTGAQPAALIEGQGRHARVTACTQGAARLGVYPGQTPQAALALAPRLHLLERDGAREHAALLKLAAMAQGFTPTVSLESPNGLLLEVAGSAPLFGGVSRIGGRVQDAAVGMGFTAMTALAPTPLAALWLALASREAVITQPEELRSALGKLPVHAITWPPDTLDAFDRIGVRHVVDLFRLPREGLTRRFGLDLLALLDRATGQLPDPRVTWRPPARIRLNRELPGEFDSMPVLQPHVERMLEEFCRELQARDAAVDRVRLSFRHWRQTPTVIAVGSVRPHRDAAHWQALVQNHLASLTLTAPVHELVLMSGRLDLYDGHTQDLPGTHSDADGSAAALVDRLRARLGRRGVFGVAVTQDARPEHASRGVEPGDSAHDPRIPPPRPLELLPSPRPLTTREGRPQHNGAHLRLFRGPERIEGGWWDGEDWVRDYYQALSERGERLWIFLERRRWFLHGYFA